jgi:hypothetical protein
MLGIDHVIFNQQVEPRRDATIRVGWNDGAWGRPRRMVTPIQATWYDLGYESGGVFRLKQKSDLSQRSVISSALPRPGPGA